MEEQRQRQEDEQRRALAESDPNAAGATSSGGATASASVEPNTEEAMLQRALALSTETPVKRSRVRTTLLSFPKLIIDNFEECFFNFVVSFEKLLSVIYFSICISFLIQ